MTRALAGIAALAALCCGVGACGDDDDSGENTGQSCESAAQCYPGVDQTALAGTVTCMDRVEGGYCTHTCSADADCCAVQGECQGGLPQVCAPFESEGVSYCFLSCEDVADETVFCQENANPAFGCRSTGGGSQNRKVCVP
jgi:hypothetical protein